MAAMYGACSGHSIGGVTARTRAARPAVARATSGVYSRVAAAGKVCCWLIHLSNAHSEHIPSQKVAGSHRPRTYTRPEHIACQAPDTHSPTERTLRRASRGNLLHSLGAAHRQAGLSWR